MISNTNIPNPYTASAKNTWGLSFTFGLTAGALIVAFGLLIPWLGFYWDDWPVILHARLGDASAFRDAYVYDRPLSFWTYSLLTPILGESPFGWHITSLLLRLATVLVFWAVLAQVWPAQKRLISWTTLLFSIYPVFTQQSISVAYSQHWLTYLLFFISIWAMLASVLKPKYFWPLTLLSLASALLHLVTMEYFWGLELLRPFLLFLVLPPDNLRKRLIQMFRQWLPYLILLTVLSIWRLFLLQFPEGTDPNTPELLYRMINQPVVGLLDLLRIGVQDITYMFFSAWFNTLQPANFSFRPDFSMLVVIITFTSGGLIFFLLNSRLRFVQPATSTDSAWTRQALMLGCLFVVLGPLPTWLLDKQVLLGLYGNRFALAAMPGLSLLFIVLIQNIISSHRTQAAILAILVALATGFHLRTGNDFRNIWEKQRNFYWQLAWRAPGLEAPTNLLADGELFSYVGSYSTSTALNLLYMPPVQTRTLGYWFVDLQDSFSRSTGFWLSGRSVNGLLRAFTYEGNSLDSLVFTYEPEAGQCLWLLDAADSADILLTTTTRDALDLSNLSRILDQPAADHLPPEEIFGPEPERTWCTIFQAASLAAQRKNWQAVLALEEEAAQKGLHPNNPRELLPFVQAHAYTVDWDRASQLTLQIVRIEPKYERLLCAKWAVFFTETPDSPDRQEAQNKILTRMTCDF